MIAGLLAGYGVAVPVGAIAALIVGLTGRTSFRVGAAAALGVATADGCYALAAVLGGAAMAQLIEPVSTGERAGLSTPGHAYLGLLGLTLLNLATIVYFGALVLGRRATDGLSRAGEAAFVVAAFAASASWQLRLAGGGSLIGRLLTGPRGRLATALASSPVIAVLAVWLVVSR